MEKQIEHPPALQGALHSQRLGSTLAANPFEVPSDAGIEWARGWTEGSDRLATLFEAWLALGHSVPVLSMGKSGQALGPMVSGLIASNGNAAGVILVGALAAHEGKTLRELLPERSISRACFEASQYGILGAELPARPFTGSALDDAAREFTDIDAAIGVFYDRAAEVERFTTAPTELGEGEEVKVARVEFDLGKFLRVLVEGLPAKFSPLKIVPREGGES